MKNFAMILSVVVLAVFLTVGNVFAYDTVYGDNITISDGMTASGSWYTGNGVGTENNEVEPNCVTNQGWDLEAFFLNGNILAAIGGFNFVAGYEGVTAGDIFISTGTPLYGTAADKTGSVQANDGKLPDVKDGSYIIKNTFGYNYVFDMDYTAKAYSLYSLAADSSFTVVYYTQNMESNPFAYAGGGSFISSGTFNYDSGLTDTQIANLGITGITGGTHNIVSGLDLSFLGSGIDFYSHLTLSCGNDNLMAKGATTPEPATMILLGSGLLGFAGLRRRFRKS